jgi:DNA-binding NarL/FixJ family response regulator
MLKATEPTGLAPSEQPRHAGGARRVGRIARPITLSRKTRPCQATRARAGSSFSVGVGDASSISRGLDELSPRELEVLGLVARGSNNREIAEALYLSPLTVKTHVSRILTKLRARDRVQLVVIAYQAGLVTP